jgi:hypothetical protein
VVKVFSAELVATELSSLWILQGQSHITNKLITTFEENEDETYLSHQELR